MTSDYYSRIVPSRLERDDDGARTMKRNHYGDEQPRRVLLLLCNMTPRNSPFNSDRFDMSPTFARSASKLRQKSSIHYYYYYDAITPRALQTGVYPGLAGANYYGGKNRRGTESSASIGCF